MPRATSVTLFNGTTPNAFVSPFSDRLPMSFYSSITVPNMPTQACLPCAMTGYSTSTVNQFIQDLASEIPLPLSNSISTSQTLPTIPPEPQPPTSVS
jgi:hypothetical protein